MNFLDANVKRPLAYVSDIADEGNVVVFGPQESYIENASKGQRIPVSRSKGVFVVQLDAQTGSRTTQTERFEKNSRKPSNRAPQTKVQEAATQEAETQQVIVKHRAQAAAKRPMVPPGSWTSKSFAS